MNLRIFPGTDCPLNGSWDMPRGGGMRKVTPGKMNPGYQSCRIQNINGYMNIYSLNEVTHMPGYDGTGPRGHGPATGRGLGPCGRGLVSDRGFAYGCGRGLGRGRGFGRGFRMGYPPAYYGNYPEPEPLSKEAQKQLLEAELNRINAEKAEIERRLTTLE